MRDYLKRVLELTKPYRIRFALGLLCGFLSGIFAVALPVSLKLAIDTVFPVKASGTVSEVSEAGTNAVNAGALDLGAEALGPKGNSQSPIANSQPQKPKKKSLASRLPAPLKKKLDTLVNWFRPPGKPSTLRLVLVIALIPASMFLRSFVTYLNTYLLAWVGIRSANDLRVRFFKHVMNLPLGFFSKTSTGELMARNEGAMAVHFTITNSFSVIIREPVTIVTTIIALVALQPFLSLLALLVFPICLIPLMIAGRKTRKSTSGVHTTAANMAKVMHESFTGIRVVKGYNLETYVVGQFTAATKAVISFFMRTIRASELPGPLIEFIGSLGVALVIAWFAFSGGGEAGTSGELLAFFVLLFNLYAPVKNLSRLHHQLTLARDGVAPIYQTLAIQSTLPEPVQPKPLRAQGAPIRFENVSFAYDKKPVLQNINLAIKPGQLVALVGRTGSGKTSMANLLLRFYDPQSGAILIGETDIRSVASGDLRGQIAIVTQQTILFDETVRFNIALGRAGASLAEIKAAAKDAHADEFIVDKPGGYDARVGEKGVNLSGGQQQRIAIARALLKDAPILILDEATSALDTEVERIVQAALERLMEGRTTICIAHRLSTIQRADLIVVLDSGRIVETGTHAELLKADGIYRRLYELQFQDAPA